MSHFSVLVAVTDPVSLDVMLAPYDEQTDDMEFREFVDETDEVTSDWEEGTLEGAYEDGILKPKWTLQNQDLETQRYPVKLFYKSFEDFIQRHHGYIPLRINGTKHYGYWHNPSAKWDWYEVGGRWEGMLLTKSGQRVSEGPIQDFDFEAMRQRLVKEELEKRSMIVRLVNEGYTNEIAIRKIIRQRGMFIEYYGFPTLDPEYWMDEVQVTHRAYQKPITFAFLSSDSGWLQRGNMGWWGSVSDEDDNYPQLFWEAINNLPENAYIYLVDCHI